MRKKKSPARNLEGAWRVKNQGSSLKHFGSLPVDRLCLYEKNFGLAGKLKIYTEFSMEEIENYQRFLDKETNILHVTFTASEHPIEILAFASASEQLLYYEIASDTPFLKLDAVFEPAEKEAYRNYNLGGFYFEEERSGNLLIGKGELKADGFPKADETGIHIRNASRAAFRIYLKSERRDKSQKALNQTMEMQMSMNRYLAKTDDISRDALIRKQNA